MAEETVAKTEEQESPKKTKKSKFKLWHKIVTGVVVAGVAIVLIVNAAASGAVKVSNSFVDAIQKNNSDAAYALLSTEAQKAVDKDQFKSAVKQVSSILTSKPKMTSKTVEGETGKAATSKITYEIKGNDGKTYDITVDLTKEGDAWRVLSFDSKAQK